VSALAGVAGTSEPDPIFALINAARLAWAAHVAAPPAESAAQKEAYAIRDAHYGGDQRCDLEAIYPPLKVAQERVYALCDIACDAEDAALGAKPSTLAGLAAQFIFAAECLAEETQLFDDGPLFDNGTRILPLLVNAARMIDAPLVSRIGLSERLAKILSYEDQAA
jgi:hypothetical protein